MGVFEEYLGIPLVDTVQKGQRKLTDRQWELVTGSILKSLSAEVPPSQDNSEKAILERRNKGKVDQSWFKHYYFPHYFSKPDGKVHYDMHQVLHTGGKSVVAFVMPRDHGKTTHEMADVIRDAVLGIMHYQIVIWGNAEIGMDYLKWIKYELLNNQRLLQDYGELITYQAEDQVEVKSNFMIQTLGMRQKIRGLKYKSYRPDKVILEDIDDDVSVKNHKRSRENLQWIKSAIYPAIHDHRGTLCAIGTAISRFTTIMMLVEELKAGAPEFERKHGKQRMFYRVYPAILDDGTPLWPEGKTTEKLLEIKDIVGPIAWAGEYMNRPIDDGIFKAEWDTFFDKGILLQPRKWIYFSGCDLSATESGKSDYKAIVTFAIDQDDRENLYVVYAWIRREGIPEMIDAYVNMYLEYGCHPRVMAFSVFETNGFQKLVVKSLNEELIQKHGIRPNVVEVSHTVNKLMRISTMVNDYRKGRIQFVRGDSDQDILREQFHDLGTSAHDDGPDAAQMAHGQIQLWSPHFASWSSGNRYMAGIGAGPTSGGIPQGAGQKRYVVSRATAGLRRFFLRG